MLRLTGEAGAHDGIPREAQGMSLPAVVGVVGAGRMGVGIAHVFAMAGSDVRILDADPAAVARAEDTMQRYAVRANGDADGDRASVTFVADVQALAGADLVIEAVPEDVALKRAVLAQVEAAVGPGTWLASNTSSLSIDALAASLRRPERVCGLHFFNPVPSSALVEIVRGTMTHHDLVVAARDWVASLGKTAIVVRDSPGFASSRLGLALGLEAIRMVEEDVASPADIDEAMVLGYRHPMGPLRLTDLVGLDVRLGIAEHLHRELGERFSPPELLRRMVAEGRLGRKTGRGFYEWSEE
jgi:3-hydroxybutyryl-CoA dehydrogenase